MTPMPEIHIADLASLTRTLSDEVMKNAAQAIAGALTAQIAQTKPRAPDPEAEDLFLRGRFLIKLHLYKASA